MSVTLDIILRKPDKVYHEGESVIGTIAIFTPSDLRHDGINLSMDGSVNLQLSSKNVGIIEAFYNAVKPIPLISAFCEVSSAGRIPAGHTNIPFELPLQPRPNRSLHETYHGVFINISYSLKCDVKRSFLSKGLQKTQQFFVQYAPKPTQPLHPVSFTMSPTSVTSKSGGVPDFYIRGHLDSTSCSVLRPFTGHIILERCEMAVRSIELQLVRVETCGCAEGYAKDGTEIQNIQIGDGDVPHKIAIPIYMIFPRLFTCPTLTTPNFKIEFEVNLVIIFENDYLVTENFPITLTREL
ncbi:hypothetical protein PPYR_14399 [Photinus pyralis]|uniref:Vacuolar protein sorting-associated protein 26C n=2 Tax=Photinus pyralis TaxID=7054 RepID=A0A5N4A543_PHOPY|nr:vacuolar protein sorting-associated protein 26C [Photinus pyralis]KAB0792440.1 hypothetical protein PPYR_14399 [Photinus pyralis]